MESFNSMVHDVLFTCLNGPNCSFRAFSRELFPFYFVIEWNGVFCRSNQSWFESYLLLPAGLWDDPRPFTACDTLCKGRRGSLDGSGSWSVFLAFWRAHAWRQSSVVVNVWWNVYALENQLLMNGNVVNLILLAFVFILVSCCKFCCFQSICLLQILWPFLAVIQFDGGILMLGQRSGEMSFRFVISRIGGYFSNYTR